ncbi:MAG TPA: ABC transporter permease [Candidatus Acidoferrales bacterium]|nr:ABC transporter permease [Candidatus Acidoferrales bacterium]
MHKIWLIVKREYVLGVKSKAFVVMTLLIPLLGIVSVVLVGFVSKHGSNQSLRLAIVDNAGGSAASISQNLGAPMANGVHQFAISETLDRPADPEDAEQKLRASINAGKLDAYLVIPSDLSKPFELHMKNTGNFAARAAVMPAVNQALIEARLRARGINVDNVSEIVRGADLEVIKVTISGESVERGQTFGIAVGLVILLYMSLLMYGIVTMRSVLEEKTTRTMEVLVSSVQPIQLLAGKILGVAGVAFTQFLIWIVSLSLLLTYGAFMAAMFGGGSFPVIHIPASLLFSVICFFFGGYFLYASMFAAIGAACSNEQDAGQLQWLAMGPLVFAMSFYWLVMIDSTSTPSIVLSEIPFLAPVLMPLRIAIQTPPAWQLALSVVLLFGTILGAVWASAKVYRIGVLMYGKRPTLPEMLRWVRYS